MSCTGRGTRECIDVYLGQEVRASALSGAARSTGRAVGRDRGGASSPPCAIRRQPTGGGHRSPGRRTAHWSFNHPRCASHPCACVHRGAQESLATSQRSNARQWNREGPRFIQGMHQCFACIIGAINRAESLVQTVSSPARSKDTGTRALQVWHALARHLS